MSGLPPPPPPMSQTGGPTIQLRVWSLDLTSRVCNVVPTQSIRELKADAARQFGVINASYLSLVEVSDDIEYLLEDESSLDYHLARWRSFNATEGGRKRQFRGDKVDKNDSSQAGGSGSSGVAGTRVTSASGVQRSFAHLRVHLVLQKYLASSPREWPIGDDVARHMVFLQGCSRVIGGDYSANIDFFALAGLRMQVLQGDHDPRFHKLSFFANGVLNDYVPPKFLHAMSDDKIIDRIVKAHSTNKGKSRAEAEEEYIARLSELPYYGAVMFDVKDVSLKLARTLAFLEDRVLILSVPQKNVLETVPYSNIAQWMAVQDTFGFSVEESWTQYVYASPEASEIAVVIGTYVQRLVTTVKESAITEARAAAAEEIATTPVATPVPRAEVETAEDGEAATPPPLPAKRATDPGEGNDPDDLILTETDRAESRRPQPLTEGRGWTRGRSESALSAISEDDDWDADDSDDIDDDIGDVDENSAGGSASAGSRGGYLRSENERAQHVLELSAKKEYVPGQRVAGQTLDEYRESVRFDTPKLKNQLRTGTYEIPKNGPDDSIAGPEPQNRPPVETVTYGNFTFTSTSRPQPRASPASPATTDGGRVYAHEARGAYGVSTDGEVIKVAGVGESANLRDPQPSSSPRADEVVLGRAALQALHDIHRRRDDLVRMREREQIETTEATARAHVQAGSSKAVLRRVLIDIHRRHQQRRAYFRAKIDQLDEEERQLKLDNVVRPQHEDTDLHPALNSNVTMLPDLDWSIHDTSNAHHAGLATSTLVPPSRSPPKPPTVGTIDRDHTDGHGDVTVVDPDDNRGDGSREYPLQFDSDSDDDDTGLHPSLFAQENVYVRLPGRQDLDTSIVETLQQNKRPLHLAYSADPLEQISSVVLPLEDYYSDPSDPDDDPDVDLSFWNTTASAMNSTAMSHTSYSASSGGDK